jgi:hypothetical protein
MRRLAACMMALAIAAPALAQGDVSPVLAGKDLPLEVKLKDLNGDWRRLTIATADRGKGDMGSMLSQLMALGSMGDKPGAKGKGASDAAGAMLGMSLLSAMFGGGGGTAEPITYTRGQTVSLGGETFLVTYVYEKPQPNLMEMAMQAGAAGGEPDFEKMMAGSKLTGESPLTLTLLNARSISTIRGIRPFDLNREIAEAEKAGGGGFMEMMMREAMKEGGNESATVDPEPTPAKPAVTRAARPATRPSIRRGSRRPASTRRSGTRQRRRR